MTTNESRRPIIPRPGSTVLVALSLLAGAQIAAASPKAPSGEHVVGDVHRAELGQPAPDFTLTDIDGVEHSLHELRGKTVVLEWFNPDCPFVKKHHQKHRTMASLFENYREKDVVWLAVNSNAPGTQGSGPERNRKAREQYGIEYPVLLDESGAVGMMYGARNTPHMYVIDAEGVLVYRGAIDDDRSPKTPGKTNFVATCLEAITSGADVTPKETKPYGCTVKYSKKGV
jgi:peroxiredoxin